MKFGSKTNYASFDGSYGALRELPIQLGFYDSGAATKKIRPFISD
tara:strand:+ start:188 stop:322 length:135 start_codon:yes stop_codon:yes gene_type:complete